MNCRARWTAVLTAAQTQKSLEYTRAGKLNLFEDIGVPRTPYDETLWCQKAMKYLVELGIANAVATQILMETKDLPVSSATLAKFFQDQAAVADQDLERRVHQQQQGKRKTED